MSEKKKRTIMIIVGAFLLSMIVIVSLQGGFISNNFHESNQYDEAYQEYLEVQQDYEDKLNDLSINEEDLAESLEDLLLLESNLQLLQDNSQISGNFNVLSQYNRNFNASFYTLKSEISYSDLHFYRLIVEHPRYSSNSLIIAARIFAGYCRPSSVQSIAEQIASNVDYPSNDECVIDGLLTYCQDRGESGPCIHFVEDGVTVNDNAKYPIETLCEGEGVCEDKSILFASLARALDYDVRICFVLGHVFVGVRLDSSPTHADNWYITVDDENYYICETTSYGWLLGDFPTKYHSEMIYSYPVL